MTQNLDITWIYVSYVCLNVGTPNFGLITETHPDNLLAYLNWIVKYTKSCVGDYWAVLYGLVHASFVSCCFCASWQYVPHVPAAQGALFLHDFESPNE